MLTCFQNLFTLGYVDGDYSHKNKIVNASQCLLQLLQDTFEQMYWDWDLVHPKRKANFYARGSEQSDMNLMERPLSLILAHFFIDGRKILLSSF